ncbi:MAG: SIS domain-containing protein [Clostridiales bacterium]|nr:SIS domain-containing protein [Clostridiales bacterium]
MNEMKIFEDLFTRYPSLEECRDSILAAFYEIKTCFENGSKLLCCGNGGSAADSDHLVGELMKGFLKKRPLTDEEKAVIGNDYISSNLQRGLPAISLCAHNALMTAFENDCAPDLTFAQQVLGYGRNGDVLIGFSTSGNSKNVVYALMTCKVRGVKSIAVTGKSESECSRKADICIKLPETETYKIQELTLPVYHCLAAMVEEHFFEL